MSKVNDGGPAFARAGEEWSAEQEGMSMRDYFAAKAMQAIASREDCKANVDTAFPLLCETVSKLAYTMADAMLKAREVA